MASACRAKAAGPRSAVFRFVDEPENGADGVRHHTSPCAPPLGLPGWEGLFACEYHPYRTLAVENAVSMQHVGPVSSQVFEQLYKALLGRSALWKITVDIVECGSQGAFDENVCRL